MKTRTTHTNPKRKRGKVGSPVCPRLRFGLVWVSLIVLFFLGCGRARDIKSVYGERNSTEGGPSVNGTGALAEMYETAGHRVADWKRLSPRVHTFDTIVWAPDDFAVPTFEQREYLENWLAAKRGRTLVYIGRDYDAAPVYWRRVQPGAPPEQVVEISRRLAAAQAEYDADRAPLPKESYARWFTLHGEAPRRDVRTLDGEWATNDIDPSAAEISIAARLDMPQPSQKPQNEWKHPAVHESLLSSEGDVLVARVTDNMWYESQIIVVTNGSFLLNLPLVNHEHRKLAAKLVEESGPPGKVLFLESGKGGPQISKKEANNKFPTGFEWLTVWPVNAILLHILALGIVFIAANFAVFGRPREIRFSSLLVGPGLRVVPIAPMAGMESEAIASSDFGKHLQYLGDLLERTQDYGYAQARLQYYNDHVKRESGARHGETKKKG
jgi:hypothetical protein